ncbi:unnamed protein product [Gadus morhua 'NCC']
MVSREERDEKNATLLRCREERNRRECCPLRSIRLTETACTPRYSGGDQKSLVNTTLVIHPVLKAPVAPRSRPGSEQANCDTQRRNGRPAGDQRSPAAERVASRRTTTPSGGTGDQQRQ